MNVFKLYTDGHIPKQVVNQLRKQGVDVVRCEDVSLKDVADIVHLNYAVENERTVLTCDNDFTRLDTAWKKESKAHFGIIYVLPHRQGNTGFMVKEILFLNEAILEGAAELEIDIWNQVTYLS